MSIGGDEKYQEYLKYQRAEAWYQSERIMEVITEFADVRKLYRDTKKSGIRGSLYMFKQGRKTELGSLEIAMNKTLTNLFRARSDGIENIQPEIVREEFTKLQDALENICENLSQTSRLRKFIDALDNKLQGAIGPNPNDELRFRQQEVTKGLKTLANTINDTDLKGEINKTIAEMQAINPKTMESPKKKIADLLFKLSNTVTKENASPSEVKDFKKLQKTADKMHIYVNQPLSLSTRGSYKKLKI